MVQMGRVALRPNHHYCRIDVPDQVAIENSHFPLEQLASESATRSLGNKWWKARSSAILCVPSAVTRVDSNYLLNPNHPDFALLQVSGAEAVWVDPRLTAAALGWQSTAQ
jgi:RES domain-containing protein